MRSQVNKRLNWIPVWSNQSVPCKCDQPSPSRWKITTSPPPRLAYKSKLAKNQSRKVRTSAKMCLIQLNNAFPPRFGTKKGRVLKCENRFFVSWINNWHFLLRCGTEYQWESSMERATIICVKGQICWEPKSKFKNDFHDEFKVFSNAYAQLWKRYWF